MIADVGVENVFQELLVYVTRDELVEVRKSDNADVGLSSKGVPIEVFRCL